MVIDGLLVISAMVLNSLISGDAGFFPKIDLEWIKDE